MNALTKILQSYAEAVRDDQLVEAQSIHEEAGLAHLHLDLLPAEVAPLDYGRQASRLSSGELFLWVLDQHADEPVFFLQRRDGIPSDPPLLTGAALLYARFRHGNMLLIA